MRFGKQAETSIKPQWFQQLTMQISNYTIEYNSTGFCNQLLYCNNFCTQRLNIVSVVPATTLSQNGFFLNLNSLLLTFYSILRHVHLILNTSVLVTRKSEKTRISLSYSRELSLPILIKWKIMKIERGFRCRATKINDIYPVYIYTYLLLFIGK